MQEEVQDVEPEGAGHAERPGKFDASRNYILFYPICPPSCLLYAANSSMVFASRPAAVWLNLKPWAEWKVVW